MLGILPVRRKTTGSVLGYFAWDLLLVTPFVIAYWVLTEIDHGSNRSCYGIPWDVANFARWAYLGFAIYLLATLPLNLMVMKRSRKLGRESRLAHWLQMGDVLLWLANWALWFYTITALANRSQCHFKRLNGLFWANVFISAAFGLVGLILGLVMLGKFISRLLKEIAEEAKLGTAGGVDVLGARGGLGQGMKQTGVEILEVRKTNVDDRNRVRPGDNPVVRSEYIERREVRDANVIDKGEARVISNNGILAEGMKKEEGIIHRREDIRERDDIRDRNDPRYMVREERLDIDDSLPTNANNIRSNDIRAGQPRKI